jgi:hypothetical protein
MFDVQRPEVNQPVKWFLKYKHFDNNQEHYTIHCDIFLIYC